MFQYSRDVHLSNAVWEAGEVEYFEAWKFTDNVRAFFSRAKRRI